MKRLAALAVLATALLAFGVVGLLRTSGSSSSSSGGGGPAIRPYPAPAFDLPSLRDPSTRLTLGAGPVLLNFFDSTCVTCIREMPALQKMANEGKVRVIGVDLLDRRGAALRLVKRTGITYPVAFDEQGTTVDTYGVLRLPTTFAIDRAGRVVDVRYSALTEASARRWIGDLQRAAALRLATASSSLP